MTRRTENHSYVVPTEGDDEYQSTFSEYFDNIDEDIEIRDVESSRNDYQPYEDAKFFATDTGAIYIGDGNNWNQITIGVVSSVFGRTGDISAQSGDYSYSQISGTHDNTDHSETYAVDGDAQPPESHDLGGAVHTADTLANLNSKITDATVDDDGSTRPPETHDNTAHSETYAVDGDAQPPESHGDSAHTPEYINDGDGIKRRIWVIAAGASDPAGATAEDIIFEEQ